MEGLTCLPSKPTARSKYPVVHSFAAQHTSQAGSDETRIVTSHVVAGCRMRIDTLRAFATEQVIGVTSNVLIGSAFGLWAVQVGSKIKRQKV